MSLMSPALVGGFFTTNAPREVRLILTSVDFKFHVDRDLFSVSPVFSRASLVAHKESACNVGDLGSIPGLEDPLEKGMGS